MTGYTIWVTGLSIDHEGDYSEQFFADKGEAAKRYQELLAESSAWSVSTPFMRAQWVKGAR